MIDFKDIKVREAFRDFILHRLDKIHKNRNWLAAEAELAQDTIDRILSQKLKPYYAPTQTTRARIFIALECSFGEFEEYFYSLTPRVINNNIEISLIKKPIRNILKNTILKPRLNIHFVAWILILSVTVVAITTNQPPSQLTLDDLLENTNSFYSMRSHVDKLNDRIGQLEKLIERSQNAKEITELKQELTFCENSLHDLQNSYHAQVSIIKNTVMLLQRIKHLLDADILKAALLDLSNGKLEKAKQIFNNLLDSDRIANSLSREIEYLFVTMATNKLIMKAEDIDTDKDYKNNPSNIAETITSTDTKVYKEVETENNNKLDGVVKNDVTEMVDYYETSQDFIIPEEAINDTDDRWFVINAIKDSGVGHYQLQGEIVPVGEDGIHDINNKFTLELKPPVSEMRKFPRDTRGVIDWVKALDRNLIKPRAGLIKNENMRTMDVDVIFKNTASMPYVRFSHLPHTEWLSCKNCHPKPFVAQRDSNFITMAAIIEGEYCGVCHGKVAFPPLECNRCHSVERGTVAFR